MSAGRSSGFTVHGQASFRPTVCLDFWINLSGVAALFRADCEIPAVRSQTPRHATSGPRGGPLISRACEEVLDLTTATLTRRMSWWRGGGQDIWLTASFRPVSLGARQNAFGFVSLWPCAALRPCRIFLYNINTDAPMYGVHS